MKLLSDDHYEVLDIYPVSETNCLAQYKFKDCLAPVIPNSSVLIGIMVTSYARIQLYGALEKAVELYGLKSLLCK